ncbi:MAG: tetratricopeptide repeat protein [Saprospiraceae bacterium]|nr:tetratricopeptide repeat protein [Saprospiraceae bacterium]
MFKNIFFRICFLLPGLISGSVFAQNTIGGEAKIVPEAEVDRQSLFIDAERQRLLGHNDKAVDMYKQFLYANTDNAAAWYGLARSYGAQGDPQNALDAANKAVAADATNQWYQIYRADLLEQLGNIREAVKVYETLTKQFPHESDFWRQYSYLAVLNSDPKTGLKALDQLEKITGVTEESTDKKHMIYLGMGDAKKAAAELQRLADLYPSTLEYRHHLAEFYTQVGDKNAARKVYEDILRRDPTDPVAQLAVLEKSGSDIAYIQTLKPLFRDPGVSIDAKVKELLPYFDKLNGRTEPSLLQALLDLGQLVETAHPNDPKAWSLSGDLLYYADRPNEALARYRTCIKLNPTIFSVWENTLEILSQQKNYDELYPMAEKAMDDFPNQAVAYYYFGLAATEKGKPDEAIAQLEQATLMAGNNLNLRLALEDQIGLAQLRKKDFAAAANTYAQALNIGGDKHARILEHYGDTLIQLGEREKAMDFWQKANKLEPSPQLEQKISTGKL